MADRQETAPRRLVIVDDDREFRELVARVARPLGWEVTEFSNGAELLASLGGAIHPDLIILDIIMPDLDGIETIGSLGGSSVRCPVVLVTGRSPLYTSAARELGQANGLEIVDALHKPVSLSRLREILTPRPQPD
jgi:CheY-like chemotaxis protein